MPLCSPVWPGLELNPVLIGASGTSVTLCLSMEIPSSFRQHRQRHCEVSNEPAIPIYQFKKHLHLLPVLGCRKANNALFLSWSTFHPFWLSTYPKYFISSRQNLDFSVEIMRLAFFIRFATFFNISTSFSNVREQMIVSSGRTMP